MVLRHAKGQLSAAQEEIAHAAEGVRRAVGRSEGPCIGPGNAASIMRMKGGLALPAQSVLRCAVAR